MSYYQNQKKKKKDVHNPILRPGDAFDSVNHIILSSLDMNHLRLLGSMTRAGHVLVYLSHRRYNLQRLITNYSLIVFMNLTKLLLSSLAS